MSEKRISIEEFEVLLAEYFEDWDAIKELIAKKTGWSADKITYLMEDTDGHELIPFYGIDAWIEFVQST